MSVLNSPANRSRKYASVVPSLSFPCVRNRAASGLWFKIQASLLAEK